MAFDAIGIWCGFRQAMVDNLRLTELLVVVFVIALCFEMTRCRDKKDRKLDQQDPTENILRTAQTSKDEPEIGAKYLQHIPSLEFKYNGDEFEFVPQSWTSQSIRKRHCAIDPTMNNIETDSAPPSTECDTTEIQMLRGTQEGSYHNERLEKERIINELKRKLSKRTDLVTFTQNKLTRANNAISELELALASRKQYHMEMKCRLSELEQRLRLQNTTAFEMMAALLQKQIMYEYDISQAKEKISQIRNQLMEEKSKTKVSQNLLEEMEFKLRTREQMFQNAQTRINTLQQSCMTGKRLLRKEQHKKRSALWSKCELECQQKTMRIEHEALKRELECQLKMMYLQQQAADERQREVRELLEASQGELEAVSLLNSNSQSKKGSGPAQEPELCTLCVDSPLDTALCPCGHIVCCGKCARMLKVCPICRHHVVTVQKVFLPS